MQYVAQKRNGIFTEMRGKRRRGTKERHQVEGAKLGDPRGSGVPMKVRKEPSPKPRGCNDPSGVAPMCFRLKLVKPKQPHENG